MNKNAVAAQDFLDGTELRGSESIEIARAVLELDKAIHSPRHPSFWERREQALKAQAEGDTDLSNKANLVVGRVRHGQKVNRNIAPGRKSLSELLGVNIEETDAARSEKSERSMPQGEAARCARHCFRPGRTSCQYCHGLGFEKVHREYLKKQIKELQEKLRRESA